MKAAPKSWSQNHLESYIYVKRDKGLLNMIFFLNKLF